MASLLGFEQVTVGDLKPTLCAIRLRSNKLPNMSVYLISQSQLESDLEARFLLDQLCEFSYSPLRLTWVRSIEEFCKFSCFTLFPRKKKKRKKNAPT